MMQHWIPDHYEDFRDIIETLGGRRLPFPVLVITDGGRRAVLTDGTPSGWLKTNHIVNPENWI